MDDSMDSVLTDEEGIDLYKQLSELWEKAGIYTYKWLSNSLAVLNKIPSQDRVYKINLDEDNFLSIKALGIMWLAAEDVFTFESKIVEEKIELTKHNFLKRVPTLFDPLGFLPPFTIRTKILIQETWIHGLDWDEQLPKELSTNIVSWFAYLVWLSEIKVPRCLQLKEKVKSVHLHIFLMLCRIPMELSCMKKLSIRMGIHQYVW